MSNNISGARRVVIKVGTSTLTYDTGLVNIRRVEQLIKVMSDLVNSGIELVFVTSGAIGVGAGKLGLRERPGDTPGRQAAAAVGQSELMHIYDTQFQKYNHVVAQLLLTKDVIDDEHRRRNVVNTVSRLLSLRAVPIINENDTVAVDELEGEKIGDNDTLSALVAQLVRADALILMTDIDGLYDADPRTDPAAKLIPTVTHVDGYIESIASGTGSNRGTGGMSTKISAAKIAEENRINMVIVNGEDPDILYRLFDGEDVGTAFLFGD